MSGAITVQFMIGVGFVLGFITIMWLLYKCLQCVIVNIKF